MTTTARTTIAVIGVVLMWAAAGQAQSCPGDFNGDHRVTVDEILMSVNNALNDCPQTWLAGKYSGQGWDKYTCLGSPATSGESFYQPVVLEISTQDGGSFSGTITVTDQSGKTSQSTITGVVSGTREISGQYTATDPHNPSGTFTGTAAGDTVTVLTVKISETIGNCQTVDSNFLLVRSWPSQ
jgi:hypothetical protein